jgi:psiF repeat
MAFWGRSIKNPILAQQWRVTKGVPSRRKNIVIEKARPPRLHSSAVQHRSATLRPSSTRGASMMTLSSRLAATAVASLLLMGSAFAQTTAPAAAPAAKAEKAPMVHSAASVECSKEADAKGLHGKERKKFRSECKKAAAEKK